METAPPYLIPPRPCVTTAAPEAVGHMIAADGTAAPASALWPASGTALLVPFTLTQPITVRNLFWYNGNGDGAIAVGPVDCGIYDGTFTRLLSTGSTAQAGINLLQTVSVAATVLPPGRFYLALSATSATVFRWSMSGVEVPQAAGVLTAGSAFPLPATITGSGLSTAALPLFGLASRLLVTS